VLDAAQDVHGRRLSRRWGPLRKELPPGRRRRPLGPPLQDLLPWGGRGAPGDAGGVGNAVLPAVAADGTLDVGPLDRRRIWRRWLLAVFLGETLGFLVPVLAVVLGADGWSDGPRLIALAVAG